MDLFNNNPTQNILPFDGEVIHLGNLLNSKEINYYFTTFLKANFWKHDELILFGKHIKTNRKVAWFGDTSFKYSYSNTTKQALIWTPELLILL